MPEDLPAAKKGFRQLEKESDKGLINVKQELETIEVKK